MNIIKICERVSKMLLPFSNLCYVLILQKNRLTFINSCITKDNFVKLLDSPFFK